MRAWHWILLAMLAALITGGLINAFCVVERGEALVFNAFGSAAVAVFAYLGTLFMNLLKMIIVPLVFSSIVIGVARLGGTLGFARLGLKTLAFYALSSLAAILVGLVLVNTVRPGLEGGEPNAAIRAQFEDNTELYAEAFSSRLAGQDGGLRAVTDLFLRMVPENVFDAFGANDQMLALIFVSLVAGFGLVFVSPAARRPVLAFFEGINELTLLVTRWVMWLAPIGIFALVARTTAQTGFEILFLLGKYLGVVLAALAIHAFVVLPLVLRFIAGVSPLRHFRVMRGALLTAFSTASSAATLPLTMTALREGAGVSDRVTSFVTPLGATVNMDGTALYECVAVIFIAQVLGFELTFGAQFTVVMLALLTSIGVAGVPSAGLVAMTIIVYNIGIPHPEAAIGLVLAVDRPLDMARTAVNVLGDSCAAVVVASSEGERVLQDDPQ